MRSLVARVTLFVACLTAGSAAAQNREVRPYFLVIVDTSGSMQVSGSAPANSCGYTGGNSASGQPTKIDAVKCALGKIINATGDADFGLMQFADNNMNCTGPANCGPTDQAAWLRVPIQTNNTSQILALIDKSGTAPAAELCAAGNTPLGGVLIGAREYFEGTLMNPAGGNYAAPTTMDAALRDNVNMSGQELCRPLSVILLTDGAECCNPCMASWSDGCPKTIAHNPNANVMCDVGCVTPVGDSSCTNSSSENAPDRAEELLNETQVPSSMGTVFAGIKTYPIGFGSSVTPPNSRIEHIAIGGGTDNPDPNLRGFYATDEKTLSKALTQIIADAQPPVEICNNMDDDCDGLIDEGIPKYCNLPAGITDKTLCTPPPETKCDGKDDNCNGIIDEGLLNACGTCGEVPMEICDGMDNDCDGRIDEDVPGGACGNSMGICMPGTMQCIDGMTECTGAVGPQPESCNCKDDDCDGMVDEDPDNSLCPDGKCIGCTCVPHCQPGMEFMASCPNGRRAEFEPSGECLCVTDNCDAKACAKSTLMRDSDVGCAPDDPSVAPCFCTAGMCVARCDGVSCASDSICDKHTGRCVQNNCLGLGCADGELCDPVMAECMKDPCADAGCAADQVCRAGKCEKSCADVACDDDQSCEAGSCVKNLCYAVHCDSGQACDPKTGKCASDMCFGMTCGAGLACSASTGQCERDPCFDVRCPSQQNCTAGQCMASNGSSNPVPPVTPAKNGDSAARVLAAGGGGCACRVSHASSAGGTPWLLVFLLGVSLRFFRWRGARGLRAPHAHTLLVCLCAACGLYTVSCKVDPFCLTCGDAGKQKPGGNAGDSGSTKPDKDGSTRTDASADAGDGGNLGDSSIQPTCTPQPEVCDGKDNDCDFKVDEDTVSPTNDCMQSGVCAGTMPTCIDGKFQCRYPDEHQDEETKCDGKDEDCDGKVDETFMMLNASCDVGTGACKVQGKQVCNSDGMGVHCEAKKTIPPSDEICDGIDNDCDGMVDEPRSNPGSSPSFVQDDVVQVSSNLWVYKYEASRPDATSSDQGIIGSRACSRAGVLPWTSLTYSEALQACQDADMDLCLSCAVGDPSNCQNDWQTICEGGQSCALSYTPSGTTCAAYPTDSNPCNGHDQTAQAGAADDDTLAPTGAHPQCFTHEQGGDIFDLSGNAKEWTKGPSSPDSNPLRGGSYNNLPGGMRCDFDFNVAADSVRLPNVGFRCCSTMQP